MCLTYGRVHLLEEAIESFLRQDYPGEKELLVLNDLAGQTLRCDHPEVTVVNLAVRFRTVGEKRNAAAALARHDLLAVWDDDDIYLPHRLRYSMEHYDPDRRFYKPVFAFHLNNGEVSGPKRHVHHSAAVWHRSLFDEVRGYAHMGAGQDQEIERHFAEIVPWPMNDWKIAPADIYYLYRWAGTGSYHNSGEGRGAEGSDRVGAIVSAGLDAGEVPTGRIRLKPRWRQDYAALVADHIATLSRPVGHLGTPLPTVRTPKVRTPKVRTPKD
jgi:hypothetical protein